MDLEWDTAKSCANERKHGLSFDVAVALFAGPLVVQADGRRDYGEVRLQAIGSVEGRTLLCVYTLRNGNRRVISLRVANRRERDAYRAAQLG